MGEGIWQEEIKGIWGLPHGVSGGLPKVVGGVMNTIFIMLTSLFFTSIRS